MRTARPALVLLSLLGSCLSPSPQPGLAERLRQLAADGPIVVAHRGDSASHPENTIPAFASALAVGAPMVELDFRATADGVLVCMHDATLDRTTDAAAQRGAEKIRIDAVRHAELATLDAGAWKDARFAGTRIPDLATALEVIQRGSVTMIEHKAGTPEALLAVLRALELETEVLVQSFDWRFLEAFHQLAPHVTLAALGGSKEQPRPTGPVLEAIARTGASMVHWSFRRLTAEDVRRLHREGYLVCVYTVNEPADHAKAVAMGVDAITTDHPARLRDFLR